MSPTVHSEIEFEFREDDDDDGRGEFVACGKVISALRQMLGYNQIEAAAELFAACADDVGDELIADIVAGVASRRRMKALALMFHLAKDFDRAAHCAERAGDYDLAALVLTESGKLEAAAELYRRAGDMTKAAALLERNLSFASAAEIYLQLKDYPRAAGNLERAGQHLQAGRVYAQMSRFDAALAVLQRVAPSDGDYAPATLLVGRILEHTNHEEAALQRYWAVVQQGDPGPEARPVWLRLATRLADAGETVEARQLVDRLLLTDPGNQEGRALWRKLPPAPDAGQEKKKPTFELSIDVDSAQATPAPPPPTEAPPRPATGADPPPLPDGPAPPARQDRMVGVDHDFEFLRRVPLFSRLSLEEQKYVRRLCDQARFKPGESLIDEGQPGEAMFVIIRGKVDVRSTGPGGTVSLVAELGPGTHVGEMALLDDAPTSASVVARETVYAFRLARDQFQALLQSNERIQLRIFTVLVQTLAKRLREANAKLAAATGH